MKINAVGVDYSVLRAKNRNVKEAEAPKDIAGVPKGMSMISFKSGNPRHIAHMVAEEPLMAAVLVQLLMIITFWIKM